MGLDCPNLLSFGSRSLLVSSSFVSRSSLVAYSLIYRRPNEDRTRNKQKTNERATNVGRETNEKLSKTRRGTALLDGKGSFLVSNVKPNKLNWIAFITSWNSKTRTNPVDDPNTQGSNSMIWKLSQMPRTIPLPRNQNGYPIAKWRVWFFLKPSTL